MTPGFQYALVAIADGEYNVYSSGKAELTGKVKLKAGDVWKYGETTSDERYSQQDLIKEGVDIVPQFFGTQGKIKIMEKVKIYNYFFQNVKLPPGNKIFR